LRLSVPDVVAEALVKPGREWWEKLNIIQDALSRGAVLLVKCEMGEVEVREGD
jgi:protein-tyrosine phosphatase